MLVVCVFHLFIIVNSGVKFVELDGKKNSFFFRMVIVQMATTEFM